MATTYKDYTGDGNATKNFTFPSLQVSDVKVEVDGVLKTVSTHYNIQNYSTTGGGDVVFTSGNIPASPSTIRILRDTSVSNAKATYEAGASLKADDLNNNQLQAIYALQEEQEQFIATTNLKDDSVTVAKIADAQLKDLANNLSSTASELNQLDGKTISDTLSNASTNIPTGAAVNTWVINLLNALGGFVAITEDNKFPNANPDPNDDAGTIVSVADAGGLVITGSGSSTTGRTLGGATVTITGFPASLYGKTLEAGMGLLVQTTSTLNTYTYHRSIGKDSDLITLSDTVNSFNNRYRQGTTDPTSDNDQGDLFFNTTQNQLKVYDDSSWVRAVPSDADLSNLAIVAGELGWSTDMGFITGSLTTATDGNIDIVADNITSVNRYANEYKIAASAPGSPSEGDLWYDSSNDILKYYNGTTFIATTGTLIDEDNMSSNSATQAPTQQSVKAYVDGLNWLDQSAKTDGSLIYYNNSASKYKADATITTSTIVDGGSF